MGPVFWSCMGRELCTGHPMSRPNSNTQPHPCRQRGLLQLLKAYTVYRPREGYCQAQGPVAAVLLMHMPAEVSHAQQLLGTMPSPNCTASPPALAPDLTALPLLHSLPLPHCPASVLTALPLPYCPAPPCRSPALTVLPLYPLPCPTSSYCPAPPHRAPTPIALPLSPLS